MSVCPFVCVCVCVLANKSLEQSGMYLMFYVKCCFSFILPMCKNVYKHRRNEEGTGFDIRGMRWVLGPASPLGGQEDLNTELLWNLNVARCVDMLCKLQSVK